MSADPQASSRLLGPAAARRARHPSLGHWIEYLAAAAILKVLGWLPPSLARAGCEVLAALSYCFWPRLRRVGMFNLALVFPDWPAAKRRRVLFRAFQNWGRMLADFARFPRLNRANIAELIVYDGFEHYARARDQGKGVIFLTAHFGNWELSSFAHGAYGYPLGFTVREMDNPLLDALITRYRASSGGQPIEKNEFARRAWRALKDGEAVGILIDTNMLAPEGVFADFLGRSASTTTAPARLARKTGAPLVLGLAIWDAGARRYRLRFEPVEWIRGEDAAEEILLNTAHFNRLLEAHVRQHPDQWLWVHRRWKTRPPDEPPLYPF